MNFMWDNEKNKRVKRERNVCFEDAVASIQEDRVLDIVKHPNCEKYPDQSLYILRINGYIHMVPFVKKGNEIWLITIIPSRKLNKIYKGSVHGNGSL